MFSMWVAPRPLGPLNLNRASCAPSREYGHEQTWKDGNAHSHLQATAIGPDLTVPISEGQLKLGTWQQIFLLECDTRSRKREIVVTVIGE
jgi:secondary thiamine-phosphate synthase enzyme